MTKNEIEKKLNDLQGEYSKLPKHDFFFDAKDQPVQNGTDELSAVVTVIMTDDNSDYAGVSVKVKVEFSETFKETGEISMKPIGYYVPKEYYNSDKDWFEKYMEIISKIIEVKLVIIMCEECVRNYETLCQGGN